ncbi:MAG TPA: ATP-binding protein [Candidatus Saccharimonadales bacterium]|jgi:PAS domain S-box-containing protein|nr:ATP-binding protein [Candidatus Saccharimonadales bacterium]
MSLRVLICGEEHVAQQWLRELPADVVFRVSSSRAEFEQALQESWDVVLSSYRIDDFGVLDALEVLRRKDPATPLVVVAGAIGAQAGSECIRAGAAVLVGEEDLRRLQPAMEEAVREAQERNARVEAERERFLEMASHRATLQRSLAGFYLSTIGGKLLDCNVAFARIFGFESAAEIRTRSTLSLYLSPADRDAFLARIKAHRQVSNLVTPMLHRDGSTIWILENTTFIEPEDGGEARMEGTIMDITSRKQAEDEEERLRSQLLRIACEWIGTFDAVTQPLVLLDPKFNIVRLNRAFKEAAGMASFQECAGKPLSAVSTGEPWHSSVFFAREVAAGRAGIRKVQGADGMIWEIDGAIFPGTAENDPRIILTFRDITERVQAEEGLALLNATLEGKVRGRTRELAQANAELSLRNRQVERSNRMKSVFLANMSHELRTPLNAIIGFTELLREQLAGPLNDKQRDYLGHVFKASKHLLGLINDVLDLAKIEAGQITLNPESIDLPSFLADVKNLIAPMTAGKGLICEAECEPGLVLYTDAARLRQILLNLAGNAVKFTPASGRMKISAQRDGAYITISVLDSGVGIAVEEQEAVFEEFFRATLGAGISSEGAGLGLPMVKRLVERMGGSVKMRSAPQQGSEFSFTVPLRHDTTGVTH